MKQSCNKKEKNRTNIFLREKARKKKQKNTLTIRIFFKTLKNQKK
jgi:hypothetical protein